MKIDLNDGEQIQRVFVRPLVDALRAEIAPLIEAGRDHEQRLGKLESNQSKALWGFGAVSAALALIVGSLGDWVRRKTGL